MNNTEEFEEREAYFVVIDVDMMEFESVSDFVLIVVAVAALQFLFEFAIVVIGTMI